MPVAIADHAKPLRLLAIDDNSLPVLRQTFHRQGYGERCRSSGCKSIFRSGYPRTLTEAKIPLNVQRINSYREAVCWPIAQRPKALGAMPYETFHRDISPASLRLRFLRKRRTPVDTRPPDRRDAALRPHWGLRRLQALHVRTASCQGARSDALRTDPLLCKQRCSHHSTRARTRPELECNH